MPALYVILALCLLLGAAFGYFYLRSAGRLPSHSQFLSYLDRGPERYRHLSRLFSAEDFAFVERGAEGYALVWQLGRERRRLLRVVLGQLRQEFEALQAMGSMLALSAAAQSDQLSLSLVQHRLRFYSTYYRLLLYSYWPLAGPGGWNPSPLLEQVQTLRQTTRRLTNILTAQDLEQLRSTFLSR